MKFKILFFLLPISVLMAAAYVIIPSVDKNPGLEFITQKELSETVQYLSSDKFKGRLVGSTEYNMAADYMAKQFAGLGLKPMGDSGFFQKLKVEYNEIICPCHFSKVNKDGSLEEYKAGVDYAFRGFTGSGNIKAPVVFCGYGISQPEDGYDDYQGIDVKGKVVIIFKQMPAWKLNKKDWVASLRARSNMAAKHGAVATLFVSRPNDATPQKPIGSVMDGEGEQNINHPTLQIDINVADDFLDGSGFTLKELQSKIDTLKKPNSMNCTSKAIVEVKAKYEKEKTTMNVAALLTGSDPVLKNEYIIISAHLDHVGSQGEVIYPGANDNASGSAGVLQIARAFVRAKINPKRSVLFVLFAGEELGLNGAKYCAGHPIVPVDKTTALLNMDCIGFGDSIQVGNGKSSPLLWNIANLNDSLYTKQLVKRTWNGGGADATPFHEKGIPCLYFVTTNSYKHLHLPSDKTETLNMPLYEKVVKLAYLTAYEVAQGNYKRETVKP